jgi:hypothetical protein
VRINKSVNSSDAITRHLTQLRQQVSLKVDVFISMVFVYVRLKLLIAHFVARLKLSVLFSLRLDSVIRQVNKLIRKVFY